MSSSDIFWGIGDLMQWTFGIFEVIGNSFNYFLVVLGFVGFAIWMNMQKKYNAEAEANPNQIK